MAEPTMIRIKTGWAALGKGWAVHANTEEEARRRFEETERRHKEMDDRPFFYERLREMEGTR